jgi:hypothetical protein
MARRVRATYRGKVLAQVTRTRRAMTLKEYRDGSMHKRAGIIPIGEKIDTL